MLRATYVFTDRSHSIVESMVAGTVAGEMSFLSRSKRNATVVAERDSVLWKMSVESHDELGKREGWTFARKLEQCLLAIAIEEQDGAFATLRLIRLRTAADFAFAPFSSCRSPHGEPVSDRPAAVRTPSSPLLSPAAQGHLISNL